MRGPGDSFGEISILSQSPHTANAITLEPTSLLEIPKDAFLDLVERSEVLRHAVGAADIRHVMDIVRAAPSTDAATWQDRAVQGISYVNRAEHEAGRLPVRVIQTFLGSLYRVHVSLGAIVGALHTLVARGAAAVTAIRDAIRASPVVHADETGWREDGHNGDIWQLSTPTACSFERGQRTNAQIDRILGEEFAGVLVSDFYAAYHHFLGEKQRCWAHLLRDVRELLAAHPADAALQRWGRHLHRLFRATRDSPGSTAAERRLTRKRRGESDARVSALGAGRRAPAHALPAHHDAPARVVHLRRSARRAPHQQRGRALLSSPGHCPQDLGRHPLRARLHRRHAPRLPRRHLAQARPQPFR